MPSGVRVVTVAARIVCGGLGCPAARGPAARAGYFGVLDAAHEQDRGRAGPGLVGYAWAGSSRQVISAEIDSDAVWAAETLMSAGCLHLVARVCWSWRAWVMRGTRERFTDI